MGPHESRVDGKTNLPWPASYASCAAAQDRNGKSQVGFILIYFKNDTDVNCLNYFLLLLQHFGDITGYFHGRIKWCFVLWQFFTTRQGAWVELSWSRVCNALFCFSEIQVWLLCLKMCFKLCLVKVTAGSMESSYFEARKVSAEVFLTDFYGRNLMDINEFKRIQSGVPVSLKKTSTSPFIVMYLFEATYIEGLFSSAKLHIGYNYSFKSTSPLEYSERTNSLTNIYIERFYAFMHDLRPFKNMLRISSKLIVSWRNWCH